MDQYYLKDRKDLASILANPISLVMMCLNIVEDREDSVRIRITR